MDPVRQNKTAGLFRRRVSVEILGNLRRIRAEVINSLTKSKASESHGDHEGQEGKLKLPKMFASKAANSAPKEGFGVPISEMDTELGQQGPQQKNMFESGQCSEGAGENDNGNVSCSQEVEEAELRQTNMAIKHIKKWKVFAKINTERRAQNTSSLKDTGELRQTRKMSIVSEERRMSETFNAISAVQEGIRNIGMFPVSGDTSGSRKYSLISAEVDSVPYATASGAKYVSRLDRRSSLSTFHNESSSYPSDLPHTYRRASVTPAISLPLLNNDKFQPNSELRKQAQSCIKSQNFTFRNGCSTSGKSLPRLIKITHPLQREASNARAESQRVNSKLQRYLRETKSSYTMAKKLKLVHETHSMEEKNMQDGDL